VLASAIAAQAFEPVAWRHSELAEFTHAIKLSQLAADARPDRRGAGSSRPAAVEAVEQILSRRVGERPYHG